MKASYIELKLKKKNYTKKKVSVKKQQKKIISICKKMGNIVWQFFFVYTKKSCITTNLFIWARCCKKGRNWQKKRSSENQFLCYQSYNKS